MREPHRNIVTPGRYRSATPCLSNYFDFGLLKNGKWEVFIGLRFEGTCMNCPGCGKENSDSAFFCVRCGESLSVTTNLDGDVNSLYSKTAGTSISENSDVHENIISK